MRSYRDYIAYLIRQQRGATFILLVDAGLLVFAAIAFFRDTSGAGAARGALRIAMALAALKVAWSIFKIVRTLRTYLHTTAAILTRPGTLNQPFGPVRMEDILPGEEEADAGFEQLRFSSELQGRGVTEYVFHSAALDAHLWNHAPVPVRLNQNKPARVKRLIGRNRPALLKLLTRKFLEARGKQGFFNEEKLCLSRRIDPAEGVVECHRGTYFDSLLTNEACTRALVEKDADDLVADFTHMFPVYRDSSRKSVHLDDIALSAMNDHIGISTLGFTRDRYLVLWEQSSQALHSQHLLAPTGSGSCDWKDLDVQDFGNTLRRAMQRELCEESGRNGLEIGPAVIDRTLVLGFYRWVRRGGKPEFAGITRLNVNRDQLEPNPLETKRPAREKHMYRLTGIAGLPAVLQEIRAGRMSVPLAMNLHCLERFYESEGGPERLERFLFGSPAPAPQPNPG